MSLAQTANLSALLAQTAALFPDRPGLILGERTWTWSELNVRVDAFVQGLRSMGVKAGDKILVQSRNNIALFESCWGSISSWGCLGSYQLSIDTTGGGVSGKL